MYLLGVHKKPAAIKQLPVLLSLPLSVYVSLPLLCPSSLVLVVVGGVSLPVYLSAKTTDFLLSLLHLTTAPKTCASVP